MARWPKAGPGAIDAEHGTAGPGPSGSVRPAPAAPDSPDVRSRGFDALVPVLFMASGAAGLIYQVVWTQDLVLVFGDTTQAIVTTVTAFLAGLGIGALVGAAIGARLRRALAVYGLLEVAVGCLALLMPLAFGAVATLFRSAYLSLPAGEVALIRFGLAFVALTPVTLLMGMSLPVLTRHLVRADPDVGERIARLYGLNTLGAVLGSVASGYFLIELLGLRATTFVAVALNLSAGLGAILISRTLPAVQQESRYPAAARRPPLRGRQWLMLGVTFVSGLVSLALEVLWTRVMLQGTGSSIYVFVAVVAVFLIGIAAGSLIYERQKDRTPQPATLGALLAIAAGLALVPLIVSNITGPAGLPAAVVLILPVTAILGYTFPLTVRLFVDSAAQASRGVGFVYAVNTAGCVVGTVSAGFLLIPFLGTSASIIILCIAQAVAGGGLAITYAPRQEVLRPLLAFSAAAVLLLMLFVPAARHTYIQRQIAATRARTAHFDDSVASVDVTGGKPHARNLLINGEGITKLTIDTKLLAYIPKAARPDATTMLNICFGMGSTYRSSIILGLHTTAVELDPTVPTVMHWFYGDASKYLHSPLGHIIVNDGRNYVRLSNKHYDLITIDAPPPLWSAGAVVLLTREFYQEAVQRLAPGGVLTSFVPLSSTTLLLRTFRASFKYVLVVHGPLPFGLYMMGSQSPITLQASAITQVFGSPAARADLAGAPDYGPVPTSAWPGIIHKLIWLTNDQVSGHVGKGPLLTDDHPITEYFLLSSFSRVANSGPVFERSAVETGLAVMCLLLLLIIGLSLSSRSAWRRRSRLPA
jgi:spermidine synthase